MTAVLAFTKILRDLLDGGRMTGAFGIQTGATVLLRELETPVHVLLMSLLLGLRLVLRRRRAIRDALSDFLPAQGDAAQ